MASLKEALIIILIALLIVVCLEWLQIIDLRV